MPPIVLGTEVSVPVGDIMLVLEDGAGATPLKLGEFTGPGPPVLIPLFVLELCVVAVVVVVIGGIV